MPHSPLTVPTSRSRQHLGYSRYDSKMDREPGSWVSMLERRIDREAREALAEVALFSEETLLISAEADDAC